jgi:two-component system, OmpR family, sensor histidine kinase BaeS
MNIPQRMWPRNWSFGAQLFLSYLAVIAVGTAIVVFVTPGLGHIFFDQSVLHMMTYHADQNMAKEMTQALANALGQAFDQALVSSLPLGTAVAAGAAALASFFISRHIASRLRQLGVASRRIAAGHYAERVQPGGSTEISYLAESFNQMAASLEETERRRLALIGDVAHELRTPLATLEGYVEGLLDGVLEPAPETFSTLQKEAERMHRLVNDLQELSRAEAHQLSLNCRAISAVDLVGAAVTSLRSQFEQKGLRLLVTLPQNLPAVCADEDRAAQVLINLLTNAWRYTPAGGQVEVTAHAAGDVVEFSVRDTGVGVSAEDLPRIFERFYRVDRSRSRAAGGSGIGLTIARHLVEAQGGTIRASSAGPGHGATFTFTLPTSH